jgi:hypothetical protein
LKFIIIEISENMNSNNDHTTQDYSSNLPENRNSFAPLQIHGNGQHNLINNAGLFDMNINTLNTNSTNNVAAASMTSNTVFEFYFHLPNDTRIYRVTYTELHPSENIRLLNNGINLSHIPDYQFPHHCNVQSFIRQQIQQRVQQPVQQQSFDTTRTHPTSQMYSDATSVDNMQDMGYDGVHNN